MKRIAKLMCLIALVALVGTACKKQEEKRTFTASLGDGEWKTDEKLYLEGRKMWFEENDQVILCNVDYDDPEASCSDLFYAEADGVSTTFAPVNGSTTLNNVKLDAFFAYYPGGVGPDGVTPMASFDWDGTSGEIYHPEHQPNYGCFKLLPRQDYRTISGNVYIPKYTLYAAAKDETATKWEDTHFNFSPIGGIFNMKFFHTKQYCNEIWVDSIQLTDPQRNLVGNVYLRIDRVDPITLEQLILNYNPNSQLYLNDLEDYIRYVGYRVPGIHEGNTDLSHTLTLNCLTPETPTGVKVSLDKNNPTQFVLGVRPAAFYAGLTIDMWFHDENGTPHHYQKSTTTNCLVKPNYVTSLATLKVANTNILN
jgi:hypothetical protein